MDINKRREKIIKDLKDSKEYREEHINTGVSFQIRALREQKGWSQKELGIHTRMAQETISRIEDPNYGKLTLKTLKRLASAFDVALMVRFVPFGELVEWELNLTSNSLEAVSFDKDPYFEATSAKMRIAGESVNTVDHEQYPAMLTKETSSTSKVIPLEDYRIKRPEQLSQNVPISAASYQ